jgi:hypothetical protein
MLLLLLLLLLLELLLILLVDCSLQRAVVLTASVGQATSG